jgi:hypothetical protein
VQLFKTPLWKATKAQLVKVNLEITSKNNFLFASPKSQIRVESIKGGETLFVKFKSIGISGA